MATRILEYHKTSHITLLSHGNCGYKNTKKNSHIYTPESRKLWLLEYHKTSHITLLIHGNCRYKNTIKPLTFHSWFMGTVATRIPYHLSHYTPGSRKLWLQEYHKTSHITLLSHGNCDDKNNINPL